MPDSTLSITSRLSTIILEVDPIAQHILGVTYHIDGNDRSGRIDFPFGVLPLDGETGYTELEILRDIYATDDGFQDDDGVATTIFTGLAAIGINTLEAMAAHDDWFDPFSREPEPTPELEGTLQADQVMLDTSPFSDEVLTEDQENLQQALERIDTVVHSVHAPAAPVRVLTQRAVNSTAYTEHTLADIHERALYEFRFVSSITTQESAYALVTGRQLLDLGESTVAPTSSQHSLPLKINDVGDNVAGVGDNTFKIWRGTNDRIWVRLDGTPANSVIFDLWRIPLGGRDRQITEILTEEQALSGVDLSVNLSSGNLAWNLINWSAIPKDDIHEFQLFMRVDSRYNVQLDVSKTMLDIMGYDNRTPTTGGLPLTDGTIRCLYYSTLEHSTSPKEYPRFMPSMFMANTRRSNDIPGVFIFFQDDGGDNFSRIAVMVSTPDTTTFDMVRVVAIHD